MAAGCANSHVGRRIDRQAGNTDRYSVVLAGPLRGPTFAQPQPRIEAEGVPGKPFGVGVLRIQLPPGQRMGDPASGQVSLSERSGRILYPVYEIAAAGRLLRGGAGGGAAADGLFSVYRRSAARSDAVDAAAGPLRTLTPRGGVDAAAVVGRLVARFCAAAGGRHLSADSTTI